MALAFSRHLESLQFSHAGGAFQLSEVFDDWPSYTSRLIPPSACILPGTWRYADWAFTPKLLEDTAEPAITTDGMPGPGFALEKTAEMEAELEISIHSNNVAERDAVLLGIEDALVSPSGLMSEAAGPRYGILLPLPEYYALEGRFALQSARVIDDEERAMREQRDAVVTVSCQASKVQVVPVFPLRLSIRLAVERT
jgi:hypothetical protein